MYPKLANKCLSLANMHLELANKIDLAIIILNMDSMFFYLISLYFYSVTKIFFENIVINIKCYVKILKILFLKKWRSYHGGFAKNREVRR